MQLGRRESGKQPVYSPSGACKSQHALQCFSTSTYFKAAAEWLDSWSRRGKRANEPLDIAAAQTKIEDFVLNTPDHQLGQWTNPDTSPLPRTVLQTAVKWSEERKLRDWVRSVNVAHGTPVRSEAVAKHFNASLAEQELAQCVNPVRDTTSHWAVWCWRWRLKHGGKISFLRTTEPVALDDMRQQASDGITLFYFTAVPSRFPNTLPETPFHDVSAPCFQN